MTAVLVELTRTLVADFSLQEMLEHLAERVVAVLGVSGAGVLLLDGEDDLRLVAATDENILMLESLQIELDEGPCLTAYRTGERVSIADLAGDETHPRFSERSAAAGMGSVYTFPLRLDDHRLGALDLYEQEARALSDEELTAAQILADVITVYLFNARARAAEEERAKELQHRALHDPLTGLPNRALFSDRLAHAREAIARDGTGLAVVFLDIDRFKAVNDAYGHAVGDELLTAVAARLRDLLRPADTVARMAGDEFVVLCEGLTTRAEAEGVAARMSQTLRAPFAIDGVEHAVGFSLGVATSWDAPRCDDLVLHADAAMYRAKQKGGDRHEIASAAGAEVDPRRHVVRDLKAAIDRDDLELHYQPIVDNGARGWCSVEALLRWTHPAAGTVPPEVVVDVAESVGLAGELTRWTLRTACRDLERCGPDTLGVAVNASPRQLIHPRFVDAVRHALDRSGMEAERLCVEITEGALIHDLPGATAALIDLRSMGVRVALDDFGTGYSSLSYLKRIPADVLKLDRSFVTALPSEPVDRAIVAAVAAVAEVAELQIVAEGVETEAQLALTRDLGCHLAQGHLISRPIPAEELSRLRQRQRVGDR